MNNKIVRLMIVFIIGTGFATMNQTRKITGTVREYSTHDLLVGVNVIFKNNPKVGTVTDLEGCFELKTTSSNDKILVFSYEGYYTVEIDVSTASYHVVYMRESISNFNIANYFADTFSFKFLDNCVVQLKDEVRR